MGPYLGDGHNDCGEGGANGIGHYVDENHAVIDSNVFPAPEDDTTPWPGSNDFTCDTPGGLSCGPHEVVVTITDVAGNTTTESKIIEIDDCTPPETVDDAPDGWQNSDVDVTLTCSDTGSGCASTTYEVDGGATQTGNTVSLTTEGTHTITYRSTDNDGNVEATNTVTVMIDKTPPVITTSGDDTVEATGPDGATVDYSSDASDALSGVLAGSLSCNPPSGSSFPLGETTVSCTADDIAGNTGTASLTITVVDTTAPVVTYDAPTGTIITDDDPIVTATATDAVGVTSAMISIDGGAPTVCTVVDGAISCPTSGLEYGWHDIVITASDAAGNVGITTGLFCKSSGAPYLDIVCTGFNYAWDGEKWLLGAFYNFSSDVAPGAYNVVITEETAGSNMGPLTFVGYSTNPTPPGTPVYDYPDGVISLPHTLGDVLPGAPVEVVVWYEYIYGITALNTQVTACADDQCGNTYFEAPVDPLG
jgi:hypothetical protein